MNAVLERIVKELAAQRYKDKDLCEYIGISQSTFATWKSKDRQPKSDKLPLIADFLGVSLDYLMTGKETSASVSASQSDDGLTDRDKKDIAKDLNNIMEKLTSGEDGPASYNGDPLSPESAELFRDELELALKRLKIINKEKYNPYKNKK